MILNILLVVFTSCGIVTDQRDNQNIPVSDFRLHSDYLYFGDSLEEGDSLRVLANLSICDSWLIEENLFIKREGKVFLSSTNEGEFVDSAEMKLSEVEYIKCESDTLTFEYLFSKLGDERRERTGNSLSMFSLSIRTDTVRFYSLGLKDAMRMVDHYTQIKR